MKEDDFEDRLEYLFKQLGANTKNFDRSQNLVKEINDELKKIKPSTSGEGPDPTTILPQWSATGKKVNKMKIQKRRRPGGSGNIEPMGL